VFQQFHLIPYLNVVDNVLSARLGMTRNGEADARSRADQLLSELGLSDRTMHRPGQLSTGECQRTALARALLNRPQLILADEPTGNLDPANADVVMNHLAHYASNGGCVVLVTHDLRASARADRLVRLDRGRLVTAEISDITSPPSQAPSSV
jgi:ABC-type lipoprotein export system ATPase subunit